jgi:spore maturation protein CgeB
MLAERTDEHLGLFAEGAEAEFFEGSKELLTKCRHYLAHDDEHRRIAEAGFARCLRGGYDNKGRLRRVLDHLYGPPA